MFSNLKNYKFPRGSRVQLILIFVIAVMLMTASVASAKDARLEYVKKQLISSGINKAEIDKLFADKRLKLYPLKIVAYKQPNWKIIERKLYSKISVQKGKDYIKENQAAFDKAEQDFGVKKEVLAGIIAIETDFGKNSGSYPVFNVIYSRLKRWPAVKWGSQANEMIALSKFCLTSRLDCFSIKGSYAGAFGLVQFMPSSVLTYGVDVDGDGIIDLFSPIDAISSAAKFLKSRGWPVFSESQPASPPVSPNRGESLGGRGEGENQLKALASYYGSSVGYPKIVLIYASLLAQ